MERSLSKQASLLIEGGGAAYGRGLLIEGVCL